MKLALPGKLDELELPPHAARVKRPRELNRIFDPGLNLVLLSRELDAGTRAELEESSWPWEFHLQLDSDQKDVWADEFWSEELHFLKSTLREWLVADIGRLLREFDGLGGTPFRISLMVINGIMCPAFHADSYSYRLITTYRGPGTEWVPDSNVNRAGFASDDYADRILDAEQIQRVPTEHIALMQGDRLPARVSGLVHRSPANPPDAPSRIVLRMDY